MEVLEKKNFVFLSLVIITTVGIIGYLLLWFTFPPFELVGDRTFNLANLWMFSVIAYAIFSYRFWDPVPIDKNAALTFLGRPIANVQSGAPYAPLFVVSVIPVTARVIQKEFPAEPEHIYRGDMKSGEKLPDGMKPPIRIQFRDSITDEQAKALFTYKELVVSDAEGREVPFVTNAPKDGLARRVTAEPYPVIRFRINSPSDFLRNIGSEEEAVKQIEDEMISVLTRFYPRMSVAQALQNVKWMNVQLFDAVALRTGIRDNVKPWGIELQAAYVKYIYTSHGVNTAISEAAQAPFEKEKVIVTAQGTQQKLILEGKGAAKAASDLERETLEGRAAGLKKLADELEIEGREAQSAEVGRAVAEGGNTFVVGAEGLTQIAAIAAAFGKGREKTETKGDD